MKFAEIEMELSSYGIEDSKNEAYVILEKVFGISRASLIANKERDFESKELDDILKKRKERIPLQYILGEWEFMGKKFYVSNECLIPQPDTEILVEKALEILKKWHRVDDFDKKISYRVADLCTGSGCIGLSLMIYGQLDEITLMDLSPGALDMAKRNAEYYGIEKKCHFVLGDIRYDMPREKCDLIVSNPPYIPTKDIEKLPIEVKKEPHLALDGGKYGLDIISFLIGDGLSFLNENGVMLIEFGYDQGTVMDRLLREKRDTGSIKAYEILKDYGMNPRVAVIYA